MQKKYDSLAAFKRNVRRIRKQRGMSQRDLAKKMGVTQRLIAYYEKDAPNIPLTKVQEFAEALSVAMVELLDPREKTTPLETLDIRTIRKIQSIEKLPRRARDALWHNINTTLEANARKVKREKSTRGDRE